MFIIYVMSKCKYCGKEIPDGEMYCSKEHEERHALMHVNTDKTIIVVVFGLLIEVLLAFLAIVFKDKLYIGLCILVLGIIIIFMNGISVGDYYVKFFTHRSEERTAKIEDLGVFKYVGPILGSIIAIVGLIVIFI